MVYQKELILPAFPHGFHLITHLVADGIPEIRSCKAGILHVFIKHTSASLTINENADPTVRQDFESHFNEMVGENMTYYKHTMEGADDMPAHIKASLLGASVQVPVTKGRLSLGTWQGIYLCEHRNYGEERKVVVSLVS